MNDIVYWIEQASANLALEQNKQIHMKQLELLSDNQKILSWFASGKTYWRSKTIDKLEYFMGNKVFGNVLEIGAGTGWCSAVLSKKDGISKVYSLEFDLFSITNLMPKICDALEANTDKIQSILGGFDDIKFEQSSLDFIFSMGALHHSQNLFKTYSEMYKVLKPGGFVLISEPCYVNTLRLEEEYDWREAEKFPGVKNKDNGDQRFRVCQYEAYALEAGFNPYVYTFDAEVGFDIDRQLEDIEKGDAIFKNRDIYDRFSHKTYYPYFAQGLTKDKIMKCKEQGIVKVVEPFRYDGCVIILEKPSNTNYKTFSDTVY